jgi:hypothetical protein
MLMRRFYNNSDDGRQVWPLISFGSVICVSLAFFTFGCRTPKLVETHRVCDEPIGANVTIEGIIAFPRFVSSVYLTRGGAFAGQGYQVIVSDRSGGTANVTIWTTESRQPNRIGALSGDVDTKALRLYSNRGQEIASGEAARITGEVVQDPTGCAINADVIEIADQELKETP